MPINDIYLKENNLEFLYYRLNGYGIVTSRPMISFQSCNNIILNPFPP